MEVFDGQQELNYQVHPDLKAYERYLRRDGKDRHREWIYYAFSLIPNCGILCAVGYAIGQQVGGTTSWLGIVAAMSMGVIIGPVSALVEFDKSVHKSLADLRTEFWECTLTDESYHFTDKDGVTTSYPWELMKIVNTDPDYWEISCRSATLVVFRQALREDGLEEEFECRVGKVVSAHVGEAV